MREVTAKRPEVAKPSDLTGEWDLCFKTADGDWWGHADGPFSLLNAADRLDDIDEDVQEVRILPHNATLREAKEQSKAVKEALTVMTQTMRAMKEHLADAGLPGVEDLKRLRQPRQPDTETAECEIEVNRLPAGSFPSSVSERSQKKQLESENGKTPAGLGPIHHVDCLWPAKSWNEIEHMLEEWSKWFTECEEKDQETTEPPDDLPRPVIRTWDAADAEVQEQRLEGDVYGTWRIASTAVRTMEEPEREALTLLAGNCGVLVQVVEADSEPASHAGQQAVETDETASTESLEGEESVGGERLGECMANVLPSNVRSELERIAEEWDGWLDRCAEEGIAALKNPPDVLPHPVIRVWDASGPDLYEFPLERLPGGSWRRGPQRVRKLDPRERDSIEEFAGFGGVVIQVVDADRNPAHRSDHELLEVDERRVVPELEKPVSSEGKEEADDEPADTTEIPERRKDWACWDRGTDRMKKVQDGLAAELLNQIRLVATPGRYTNASRNYVLSRVLVAIQSYMEQVDDSLNERGYDPNRKAIDDDLGLTHRSVRRLR